MITYNKSYKSVLMKHRLGCEEWGLPSVWWVDHMSSLASESNLANVAELTKQKTHTTCRFCFWVYALRKLLYSYSRRLSESLFASDELQQLGFLPIEGIYKCTTPMEHYTSVKTNGLEL